MAGHTQNAVIGKYVSGGDDFLQMFDKAGEFLSGINSQGVPLGAAASTGLQIASAVLSSAQLLDLVNTPVNIIAAPGEGKIIVPVVVTAQYEFISTPYTGVSDGIGLAWAGGAFASVIPDVGFLDQTVDSFTLASSGTTGPGALASTINSPLSLFTGDVLADGDGTMLVTVWYTTLDAS